MKFLKFLVYAVDHLDDFQQVVELIRDIVRRYKSGEATEVSTLNVSTVADEVTLSFPAAAAVVNGCPVEASTEEGTEARPPMHHFIDMVCEDCDNVVNAVEALVPFATQS